MSYSSAVSKGIQRPSNAGNIKQTGNTGIYPKLPPNEDDFPPLSSSNSRPNEVTPFTANKPSRDCAPPSSHPEPGLKTDGYAGQMVEPGRRGDFNQEPAGSYPKKHNQIKQCNIQDGTQQGNTGSQNIGETLVNSGDCKKHPRKSDSDLGPSDKHTNLQHLQSAGGQQYVQAGGGQQHVQSAGGQQHVQAGGGQQYVQAGGGQQYVQDAGGQRHVQSAGGQQYVQSGGGQQQVQSAGGHQHVQSAGGQQHVQSAGGQQYVQSGGGQQYVQSAGGQQYVQAGGGQQYVQDAGGQRHVQDAGGQPNLSNLPDNVMGKDNNSWQGSSVPLDTECKQNRNSSQDQEKKHQQNSFSESKSRVNWGDRNPPKTGNPPPEPGDGNRHGQGRPKNHSNRSQGHWREQENTVGQNFHHQTKPQSFRERKGKDRRSSEHNQNTQEGNTDEDWSSVSTTKGPSQQTRKERDDFGEGARPRDTHHQQGTRHRGNNNNRFQDRFVYEEEIIEIDPEILNKYKDDDKSMFEFFWQNSDVYSQWHRSSFTVDGVDYMCAEQFMMHKKAILFEDYKTAKEIMSTSDPRKQKKLGRQVKNFVEEIWQDGCEAIVEAGNMAKFSQNSDMLNIICSSNPLILVEASPLDKIWGIGLHADDQRAWNRAYWRGENKLGKILTKVRAKLMLERELITKEDHDRQLEELMR